MAERMIHFSDLSGERAGEATDGLIPLIVTDYPAVSSDRSNSGRWNHGFLKHQLREHFAWLPEAQDSTALPLFQVSGFR